MRQGDLKTFSMIYGIFLISLGLLGFFPYIVRDNFLFGVLKVNASLNGVHILIGAGAFAAYFLHPFFQRIYFQNVGFIFAILTIFGCLSSTSIFGFIANCHTQSILHGLLAILSLYLGFKENKWIKERK
jgi:hypothetical protein